MGIPGTHSPVHSFGPAAAPGPLRMTIYSLKIIAEVYRVARFSEKQTCVCAQRKTVLAIIMKDTSHSS